MARYDFQMDLIIVLLIVMRNFGNDDSLDGVIEYGNQICLNLYFIVMLATVLLEFLFSRSRNPALKLIGGI